MADAYTRLAEALTNTTGYQPPRPGGSWRCPNTAGHAHGDTNPSLSVTPAEGKVLVHCQAGCSPGEIMAAVGLSLTDLFDAPGRPDNGHKALTRSEIVASYPYRDEAGTTILEVVRFAPKTFRQCVPDPLAQGGRRWTTAGVVKPLLYHLPELIKGIGDGQRVWIVEGEKDVEALERRGEVATCNLGGAGSWNDKAAMFFAGANVFVVQDRDWAGVRHSAGIFTSLQGVAALVRVVEAAEGKDASDHFAAGYGIDEFRAVAPETLGTIDTGEDHLEAENELQGLVFQPFKRITLDITVKPEPRPTIGPYLYRGGFTVFQSEPDVGKSWLALNEALSVIGAGGVVLYFDEEGGEDLIRERLYALGAHPPDVTERFWYFAFEARLWNDSDLLALHALISDASQAGPVELAVLDSLPDFLAAAGLSEDSAKDVTTFVNRVGATFRERSISQLALDHLVKPAADKSKKERSRYSRGSGSKLAKADATILIETDTAFDVGTSGRLRLWKTKDRYGRLDAPRIGEPARLLDVNVGTVRGGSVRIGPSQTPAQPWHGPTECMQRVVEALQMVANAGLTYNKVCELVPFGRSTVKQALEQLANEGSLRLRAGHRGSIVYYLENGIEQSPLNLTMGDKDEPNNYF